MRPALLGARLRATVLTATLTGALAGSALAAPAAHAAAPSYAPVAAAASTSHPQTAERQSARQRFAARADRVLSVIRNHAGDPYQYGAAGPNAFDCSGLIYYSFRKALGRTLPRVANDQMRASKRIYQRSSLRPGDLVFEVDRSGYAYHAGVYAGHGYFWHAPHSGSYVKRDRMYSARWVYGRIINS